MTPQWLSGEWVMPIVVVTVVFLLYFVAHATLKSVITRIRKSIHGGPLPLGLLVMPLRLLFLLVALNALPDYFTIPADLGSFIDHALSIATLIGIAWFLLRLFTLAEEALQQHWKTTEQDPVELRRMVTNVSLLRKILNFLIITLAVAGILMSFETVRQIGLSILASAGLAGIVLGFAAQRSLQTLIAGLQIAITHPIRLDDVVAVDNETGKVEEITLTYVVIRLWDERRVIVPITWFIDRPFQNWTRNSSKLSGAVVLHIRYSTPVETVRRELERIVAGSPLWDGRVAKLEVTNATADTVEIRALVSAADSSDLWRLRCYVREALIDYLRLSGEEGGREPGTDERGPGNGDQME